MHKSAGLSGPTRHVIEREKEIFLASRSAAINFPLRLLLHTIYMNILPANLHIIIVNWPTTCICSSALPALYHHSFSLCVAFNQLYVGSVGFDVSSHLVSCASSVSLSLVFYHWHFIYVPLCRSSPALHVCPVCLSDSVRHSQSDLSVCLSA